MIIILIIAGVFVLSSNVNIYNILFNINATIFIITIIVLITIFQNMSEINSIILYVIGGLLIFIMNEVILETLNKYFRKKDLLVKYIKIIVYINCF